MHPFIDGQAPPFGDTVESRASGPRKETRQLGAEREREGNVLLFLRAPSRLRHSPARSRAKELAHRLFYRPKRKAPVP